MSAAELAWQAADMAVARLQKEYHSLLKVRDCAFYNAPRDLSNHEMLLQDPVPLISARPLPTNLLEWREFPFQNFLLII